MHVGMLWFDNDPKVNLETKVSRAAEYFLKKYGKTANLAFVHPTMLSTPVDTKKFMVLGCEVRSNRSVMPNHIWIGVDNTP